MTILKQNKWCVCVSVSCVSVCVCDNGLGLNSYDYYLRCSRCFANIKFPMIKRNAQTSLQEKALRLISLNYVQSPALQRVTIALKCTRFALIKNSIASKSIYSLGTWVQASCWKLKTPFLLGWKLPCGSNSMQSDIYISPINARQFTELWKRVCG